MTVKRLLHPFFFFKQQINELFSQGSASEKFFFFLYLFSSLFFFLYTYTQIDLGLVITRIPWLYAIEKQFQYIGYFNRPLSALLYVIIMATFSILYILLWQLAKKKKVNGYTVWSIIGTVTVILTFSYNAFSYDLFNYIFDAKILTHYHQNPYLHKALDYLNDPMLGFMHWTHRSYPYGPMWLVLTVPISFIGANIFIITFFLFKILMASSYLILIYYLFKILQKNYENFSDKLVLFALNPLVLSESLVSAHNDIVMFAFAVAAVYFLIQKKYWQSFLLLIISVGIKFATVALLPVFLLILILSNQKKTIETEKLLLLCFSFMLAPLFLVTYRTNFQPWYLLYILPFIPFVTQRIISFALILVSIVTAFFYAPFLATGDWHSALYTAPENTLLWFLAIVGVAGFCYALYTIIKLSFTTNKT